VTVVPWPGRLSTPTVPPWASTRSFSSLIPIKKVGTTVEHHRFAPRRPQCRCEPAPEEANTAGIKRKLADLTCSGRRRNVDRQPPIGVTAHVRSAEVRAPVRSAEVRAPVRSAEVRAPVRSAVLATIRPTA
jgi:hypothetical protein